MALKFYNASEYNGKVKGMCITFLPSGRINISMSAMKEMDIADKVVLASDTENRTFYIGKPQSELMKDAAFHVCRQCSKGKMIAAFFMAKRFVEMFNQNLPKKYDISRADNGLFKINGLKIKLKISEQNF